ncbi:prefoldin subunit [archaeon]|nr:prefoldin subunit [archaeon]
MTEDMDKATKVKISKLQILEQRIQSLIMQKQTFQGQALETDNALGELDGAKETYKIIGNVMVSFEKEELKKDLTSKKDMAELKVKNIEKEEKKLREEAEILQKDIMGSLKK